MKSLLFGAPLRMLACSTVFVGAGLLIGTGTAAAAAVPHAATDGVSPASLAYGATPVGVISGALNVTVTNHSSSTDDISSITFTGADPDDFFALLPNACTTGVAANGGTCVIPFGFLPGALGARSATATIVDSTQSSPTIQLTGTATEGYYEATSNGLVSSYGNAVSEGDASHLHLNSPVVSMAGTGDDQGYWLVAADGGIFNYGDAGFYGSAGALPLNKPIVGMATTDDGHGYWLVASDGGIFDYGDAGFFGSAGSIPLNKPIVGMAPTADGGGYWLVASDGGIFSYGDAGFYGSAGSLHLNKPIVGMAPTPDGRGYWLVASDGGIFSYGDAHFYGSTGSIHLNKPIVGMAATPDGAGYWFVASDGGIFNYGDAPFDGSTGGGLITNNVAMASTGGPTLQAIFDEPALRARLLQKFEGAHAASAFTLRAG
jgi:ligand-binding sensor domain-containing protein